MGFVSSTDIFQHAISSIFLDLPHVLCFLDDLIVIGIDSFQEHIQEMDEVLGRLVEKGFQLNPLKSFWAKDKVKYLGFVILHKGIQPQAKKIQRIKSLARLNDQKESRGLIGMVNFNKEMWRQKAYILKPLTEKTGKVVKFGWKEYSTR